MTDNSATVPPKAPADPNTGAGLVEFLDAAIEKGWLNIGSTKALRTATQKILEVEGGWESMDLRSLDADILFERFRNLRRNDYSDDSMRVYRQRFNQALKMHLGRIDNDPNWKTYGPQGGSRASANGSKNSGKKGASATVKETPRNESEKPADDGDPSVIVNTPGPMPLMRFPFPLRDAVDVWLTLPRDLSADEADRLSVFIRSLARPAAPTSASSASEAS